MPKRPSSSQIQEFSEKLIALCDKYDLECKFFSSQSGGSYPIESLHTLRKSYLKPGQFIIRVKPCLSVFPLLSISIYEIENLQQDEGKLEAEINLALLNHLF